MQRPHGGLDKAELDFLEPHSDEEVCPLGPIHELTDEELARVEICERRHLDRLGWQFLEITGIWLQHAARRRRASRELVCRSFASSPFGRVPPTLVLPFLPAADVLRWFVAAPAVAWRQLTMDGSVHIHHLRDLSPGFDLVQAVQVSSRLHWPAVQSMTLDLENPGWALLLKVMAGKTAGPPPVLSQLRSLAVCFSAERSLHSRQRWHGLAPALCSFGRCVAEHAPLQELVLTDLRSVDLLTEILRLGGRHLRVCRASLIGPESRRNPLLLPSEGLPQLECFLVRHRDFCEQRASRQDRLAVSAEALRGCLAAVLRPAGLRVLVLAGLCVTGTRQETTNLLLGLQHFPGLSAVALRFSVPSTFGALLSLDSLLATRRAWPRVGHFALGDMSVHGFDYWPELMADFSELYPHGRVPEPQEVFLNEFRHVLAEQYGRSAADVWAGLEEPDRSFWTAIAKMLPGMSRSEVRHRVAELFPTSL